MSAEYAIAVQTLIDGPRNSVFKVTGDLTAAYPITDIIVASSLSSTHPGMSGSFPPTLLRIDKIEYSITDGVICLLSWDATTPVAITELYGRGKVEAWRYGGLQNNAGAGVTGSVSLQVVASGAAFPTDASVMLLIHTVKYSASA